MSGAGAQPGCDRDRRQLGRDASTAVGPQHYGQQPAIGGATGPQQDGQPYGQHTSGSSTGEHTTSPSGWYPDPSGAAGAERWYNGQSWSDQTRPASG